MIHQYTGHKQNWNPGETKIQEIGRKGYTALYAPLGQLDTYTAKLQKSNNPNAKYIITAVQHPELLAEIKQFEEQRLDDAVTEMIGRNDNPDDCLDGVDHALMMIMADPERYLAEAEEAIRE